MKNKKRFLEDLKNYLQKNYTGVIKDVILFGSQIEKKYNNDSDYDILIVLDNEYSWKDENLILDLCYDFNIKYNILIDVHILSASELNSLRGKQPLYINALSSGLYA
jgi:uncharacterized protein